MALVGCGVKRDELVIIPTFTFIATANAVAHCGAMPWLMDISPDSWGLDSGQLEHELNEKAFWNGQKLVHKKTGRRVAAIMPVYTLGNIPNMDEIRGVAKKYQLPVIADAAAAIGAEYKKKKIGVLADLTVISFNGNKTVTAGGGGMIVGDDEVLMKRLKHLSTTARVTAEYDHDMVGFNYRMTNIQAAVGCAQLERVGEFLIKKREIRKFYAQAFSSIKYISTFPIPDEVNSSFWLSGIVLERKACFGVKELCQRLLEKGIEGKSFWKPIHLQKPYARAIRANSLKTSTDLWDRILTLPCSTKITEEELEYVVRNVKELLC